MMSISSLVPDYALPCPSRERRRTQSCSGEVPWSARSQASTAEGTTTRLHDDRGQAQAQKRRKGEVGKRLTVGNSESSLLGNEWFVARYLRCRMPALLRFPPCCKEWLTNACLGMLTIGRFTTTESGFARARSCSPSFRRLDLCSAVSLRLFGGK